MKKWKNAAFRVLALALCILLTVTPMPSVHAAGTVAVKSSQMIFIDGWGVNMTAYNVNDNNYVRLRDIAAEIDFDVTYRSEDGTVHISTSEPYSGGASEIGQTPDRVEVMQSRLTVYVDGQAVVMTAYNIGGNNYIKLREIGAAVNFSVEWDASTNRVRIDPSRPYTPETPPTDSGTPPSNTDIPGGTAVDYSLEANPAIFDNYYTREKYNQDRQRVLDTGTLVVNWGSYAPTSDAAVDAANKFIDRLAQLSDIEKVESINDILTAHMTYKSGTAFSGDDFWTGMAYGVCDQYANMFQYLSYRVGLPCVYVEGGRLPASPTGRHAWNEVCVDGKWQFYDGTLSDSRKTLVMSDTAESANTGYTYTDDSPKSTLYRMDVYAPGSTK